mgnify:CR=1 FL=1
MEMALLSKRGVYAESHRKAADVAKQIRESRARTPEQKKAASLEAATKDLEKAVDDVLRKKK